MHKSLYVHWVALTILVSLTHVLQNRLIPFEPLLYSRPTSLRLSSTLQAYASVKTTIVSTQYAFLFCIENTRVSYNAETKNMTI